MSKKYNERKKFIRIIKNNSLDYNIIANTIDTFFKSPLFNIKALSSFEHNFKKESSVSFEGQILDLITNLIKHLDLNFMYQNPFSNETSQANEINKKITNKVNNGFMGMKNLLKRKKSAPEQELNKIIIENAEIRSKNSHPKMSLQSNSIGALYTYQIHLNESCCVEINASQKDSSVGNILIQTLNKLKNVEDPNEYCLIEYIEYENMTSKELIENRKNTFYSQDDKRLIKTRILGQNENLFLLQYVWNQMKNDNKDGFKFAKVILTRSSLLPQLKSSPLKKTHQGTNTQDRIKFSKLVRQKSFDESFDDLNQNNDQKEVMKTKKIMLKNLNDVFQTEKRKKPVCFNESLKFEEMNDSNARKKSSEKQNRRQSTSTLKRLFKF